MVNKLLGVSSALFIVLIGFAVLHAHAQTVVTQFVCSKRLSKTTCQKETSQVALCTNADISNSANCLTSVASQYKDVTVCSLLSGTGQDDCLNHVYAAQKKLSACRKISDPDNKDACYTVYAQVSKLPSVCSKITNANNRDTCYVGSVKKTSQLNYCLKIVGSGWRVFCVSEIARTTNHIQYCKKLKDSSEQGSCMQPLISTMSGCGQITDPIKKYDCIINAGINAHDITVCDTPAPQGDYGITDWKDGCINAYAVTNNDPSICTLLPATSRYKNSCTNFFTSKPTLSPVSRPDNFQTLADAFYKYQIYFPIRLSYKDKSTFVPGSVPTGSIQNIDFIDNSKTYSSSTPYDFHLNTYYNSSQLTPQKWFDTNTALHQANVSQYQSTINGITAVEFPNGVVGPRTVYFFSDNYAVVLTMGQIDDSVFSQIVYTFQKENFGN